MKHNELDHIFKEKLQHLQPERPADAWSAFEQKLDAVDSGTPELDTTLIDEVVFTKLRDYQVASAPTGWHALRRRMDVRTALTYRLVQAKILEAGIVALALLLLIRFFPTHTPVGAPVAGEKAPEVIDEPIAGRQATPNPQASSASARNKATGQPSGSAVAKTTPLASAVTRKTQLPETNSGLTLLPPNQETAVGTTQNANPLYGSVIPLMPEEPAPNLSWKDIALLEKGIRPVAASETEPEAVLPELKPVRLSAFINVGMYGGVAYNRVITPPDLENGITGFDRYTLGYVGGISVGIDYGRLEIGGGLAYTAIRYEPIPLLVTRGYFDEGYTAEKFDFVELNVLNIPLYARYNVLLKNEWRAYALAGASLKTAYETNFYGVFPDDVGLPRGVRPTPHRNSSFSNRYGWFEGGGFRENSYITLNMGVGVEHYFSERWSMFFQPTYMHNLGYFTTGMGPTQDRIHTMTILTGVRVRLKD